MWIWTRSGILVKRSLLRYECVTNHNFSVNSIGTSRGDQATGAADEHDLALYVGASFGISGQSVTGTMSSVTDFEKKYLQ